MRNKKILSEEDKKANKREYKKKYREKNKEKIAKYQKEYQEKYKEENKESNRKRDREYLKKNKEKVVKYKKEYYKKNKNEVDNKNKKYKEDNREKISQYLKEYNRKNRDKIRRQGREYDAKRRLDPVVRLNKNISNGIRHSLKQNNLSKNGRHWEDLVGYTSQELKEHLGNLFKPGMSWSNHGKWHIDHIIPKAFFQIKEVGDVEFRMCWRLENLQPMWAKDNIIKSDKIVWEAI